MQPSRARTAVTLTATSCLLIAGCSNTSGTHHDASASSSSTTTSTAHTASPSPDRSPATTTPESTTGPTVTITATGAAHAAIVCTGIEPSAIGACSDYAQRALPILIAYLQQATAKSTKHLGAWFTGDGYRQATTAGQALSRRTHRQPLRLTVVLEIIAGTARGTDATFTARETWHIGVGSTSGTINPPLSGIYTIHAKRFANGYAITSRLRGEPAA